MPSNIIHAIIKSQLEKNTRCQDHNFALQQYKVLKIHGFLAQQITIFINAPDIFPKNV